MFVAVAAAGMLASCSSDSLTAGPDPKIEPTQEERVPIQLSVASPSIDVARGGTRGIGTVGGVGDGDNVWNGQRVKVFMFKKNAGQTTLNLAEETPGNPYYENAEMITPGTDENKITPTPNATSGEAMLSNGKIKYYPAVGNYDFFGYHGDGVTGEVNKEGDPWTVGFTIDGSNDLMSTKAVLTDDQKDAGQYPAWNAAENLKKDSFYSAYAARKEIQPILQFKHLLSRLSFVIKAGNKNAAGWVEATAASTYSEAEANDYNAGLDGHKAAEQTLNEEESKTYNEKLDGAILPGVDLTEEQAAAYNVYAEAAAVPTKVAGDQLTDEESLGYNKQLDDAIQPNVELTAAQAIAYNGKLEGAKHAGDEKDDAVAAHQDVAKAVKVTTIQVLSKATGKMAVAWTAADPQIITWGEEDEAWLSLKERPAYYETTTPANTISQAVFNNLPLADYYNITNPTDTKTQDEYNGLDEDAKEAYAKGQNGYTAFGAEVANKNLIPLTPTSPSVNDGPVFPETPIGEALIVAPKEEGDYEMKVSVTQTVKDNWNNDDTRNLEHTYELTIPAPEGGFEANTSYKVILTVYGFERIQVNTEIIPWDEAARPIEVGQD